MNSDYIVLRFKENMFGEFTEPSQLKTSLAKYSIEFNDLAVQASSNSVFEAIRQTLHIVVCEKVCGQTTVFPN